MALPHAVQLLAAHLIADWAATARHMLLATGAFDGLRPLLQSPDSWLRWTAARACHRLLHISGWDCWVTVTYSTEAMAAADKAGVLTALAGMLAEAPEALSAPKDMVGYNVDQQHHSRSRRFARGTVSHLFHFLAADATRGSVYKHAVDAAVEALQQLADQGAGGDSNLAVTTRTAATEVAGLTVPSHIEALMRPGGGGSGIPLDEQTATALHALLRAQLSAAAAERIQRAGALKRLGELLAESGKMPPAAGDGGSPAEAVLVLSFPGEADATLPLPVALQLLSAALVSKLASVFEGLRQPLQDVGALDARDRAALGLYAQLGLTSFPPLEQGTPPSSSCSAAAGAAAWLAVRGVFRPGGRTRSKLTRFAMDALTSAHECGALSRIADLMAVAPAECDQTSDVVGEFVYWSSGEKEAAAAFKPALQAAVAAVAALMEHDDKHVVSEAVQKATDWVSAQ